MRWSGTAWVRLSHDRFSADDGRLRNVEWRNSSCASTWATAGRSSACSATKRLPRRRAALPECLAASAVAHGQIVHWEKLRRELSVQREEEVRGFIAGSSPEGVAVIRDGWPKDWTAPILLDDVLEFPVEIHLDAPNHAGVDRILECRRLQHDSSRRHSGDHCRHGNGDDRRRRLAGGRF